MAQFFLLFIPVVACVQPTPPSQEATDEDDTADHATNDSDTSETVTSDTTDTFTEDSSDPCTQQCPEGMVPVTQAEEILYCVDAFEVTLVEGEAISAANTMPTWGMSFDEAVELCSATPVYDHEGSMYGYKRLATSQEWEDAADGVVGDGGSTYPYGDTWMEGACATPSADGTTTITSVQPTGSFAKCVSAFGTYDQIGNIWEWTDPGLWVDSQAATKMFATKDLILSVESQTLIVLVEGDLHGLRIEIPGVSHTLTTDADGRLYVHVETSAPGGGGYLMWEGVEEFYPVNISLHENTYWVVYNEGLDGQPVPDKRGCAYYAGNEYTCGNAVASHIHTHDFAGTIGFRCVADPYCG